MNPQLLCQLRLSANTITIQTIQSKLLSHVVFEAQCIHSNWNSFKFETSSSVGLYWIHDVVWGHLLPIMGHFIFRSSCILNYKSQDLNLEKRFCVQNVVSEYKLRASPETFELVKNKKYFKFVPARIISKQMSDLYSYEGHAKSSACCLRNLKPRSPNFCSMLP